MQHSLAMKAGGLAAAAYVRAWMGSLDIQASMYDSTTDPARDEFRGPIIFVFWHEYLLAPFYIGGQTNTSILTSRHRDANWIAEAARHLGFRTIRGSTSKGGSQALLEFLRHEASRNLGIACDGPLGPRRQMAPGPIYLSSRLQIPLVLYGAGYDRPWRVDTWDRFAVPRPGSRARLVVGPRMQIPANLDRAQVEHYRQRAETLLLRLTFEAEAWAEAGTRKEGQRALRRKPRPVRQHRAA
jgi:lysophospholipid acyltransferase (LPLAT)-like uncharacterized protein